MAMVGGVVMHRRRDSGQPGASTAPAARSPASFMLTQEMGIRDGTEGVHGIWHSDACYVRIFLNSAVCIV